jgi:hypothetical protein
MHPMQPAVPSGAIDLHCHMVTPDVLDLLEREGQHDATRIVERDAQGLFLIGETATRPINARVQGGGRVRTEDEHRALFEAAGLQLTRIIPTSSPLRLVEGARRT